MATNDFFDLIGTEKKAQTSRLYDGCDGEEAPSIAAEIPATGPINNLRWAQADDRFWQAADTCDRLEPGFYALSSMPNVGPCLMRKTIATDGLIEIPDAAGSEVMEEFMTFWELKQQFAERGFLHKRGIMLWGAPGCLDADTMINYQAYDADRRMYTKHVTIERLHQLFHGITGPGKGRYQTISPDTQIRVASVDDEGRIFTNTVTNVVKSGIKPVFRLRTITGSEILATKDHKFLSNGSYIALEHLNVGDVVSVHLNTVMNVNSSEGRRIERKMCYVKHHPVARTKIVNHRYSYKMLPNARAVVEAAMNGLSREEYLVRLNDGQIEGLKFLPREHDVHHIDEDCTNDELNNLRIMTHGEHAAHHAEGSLRFVESDDLITSIEFVGDRETYDIQMKAPYHNFVANKFIVHNSGKTATLMLMARDIINHHGGIVCQVEHPGVAGMCLGMVRKIEPERRIVALIEDLDAQVERYGEDGFLALLDGETQVNGICYIATTNYPERLDKRFVDRPSRFDTIRWIGMPSNAARRVYLRAKDPTISETDLARWVKETEGFSIAHLRELVILVRCFGRPLEEAIARLEKMRIRRPHSDDAPDKMPVGFGGGH